MSQTAVPAMTQPAALPSDTPPALRTRSRTQSNASRSTVSVPENPATSRKRAVSSSKKAKHIFAMKPEGKDPTIPGSGAYLCKCPKHSPIYVSKTTYYNHLRAVRKEETESATKSEQKKKKKKKEQPEVVLAETFYGGIVGDGDTLDEHDDQGETDATMAAEGPGSGAKRRKVMSARKRGKKATRSAGQGMLGIKEEVIEALKNELKKEIEREVQEVVDKAVDRFVALLTGADGEPAEPTEMVEEEVELLEAEESLEHEEVESSPVEYVDDGSNMADDTMADQMFATAATNPIIISTDTVANAPTSETVRSLSEHMPAQTPVNNRPEGSLIPSGRPRWADACPTPSFDPTDPFYITRQLWEELRTASKRKSREGHDAERGFLGKQVGSGKRKRLQGELTE